MINRTFARLLGAMLVSSIGDWAGIIAVTVVVARLGGADHGAFAVAGVMTARLVSLLAFGPIAGVLVDRFDRRRLMVVADTGRAIVYAALPFLGLPGIVVGSFCIESLALLWGPSVEASLPTFVPREQLARANSLILVVSYGTLPVGAVLFTVTTALSATLLPESVVAHPEATALWIDAASFATSALLVSRLALGRARSAEGQAATHPLRQDVAGEWRLLARMPRARALIGSLVTAFTAAGAVTALGPLFVLYDLEAGDAAYGVLATALGVGLVGGMVLIVRRSARVQLDRALTAALAAAALSLAALAATASLWAAATVTVALGAGGGIAWVAGYTLLQQDVADEHRGRTFVLLTVSARVALLVSRVVFPLLAGAIGSVGTAGEVRGLSLDGTRVALVLGALLLALGAVLSRRGRSEP